MSYASRVEIVVARVTEVSILGHPVGCEAKLAECEQGVFCRLCRHCSCGHIGALVDYLDGNPVSDMVVRLTCARDRVEAAVAARPAQEL